MLSRHSYTDMKVRLELKKILRKEYTINLIWRRESTNKMRWSSPVFKILIKVQYMALIHTQRVKPSWRNSRWERLAHKPKKLCWEDKLISLMSDRDQHITGCYRKQLPKINWMSISWGRTTESQSSRLLMTKLAATKICLWNLIYSKIIISERGLKLNKLPKAPHSNKKLERVLVEAELAPSLDREMWVAHPPLPSKQRSQLWQGNPTYTLGLAANPDSPIPTWRAEPWLRTTTLSLSQTCQEQLSLLTTSKPISQLKESFQAVQDLGMTIGSWCLQIKVQEHSALLHPLEKAKPRNL